MVLNPSGSRFCRRQVLNDRLIAEGWLKTSAIINAFRKIKRADFLFTRRIPLKPGEGGPEAKYFEELAEINEALPIGSGQTISQPLTVAFMLELLQPESGNKILDVGSGSGWTTALLAEIVGQTGKVIGVEIIPELAEFGRTNVAKYGFIEKGIVEVICANAVNGYEKSAPYDRILVSASGREVPPALKRQLKIGGRLVIPIESSIWLFVKKSENEFEEKEYPGFVFVPLVSKPR